MREQPGAALKTVKWTIAFDAETNQALRRLFPTGRGVGTFLGLRVRDFLWREKHMAEWDTVATNEEWNAEANLHAVE